ncbi:hypothetical protein HK098_002148 [Nowakowskiella sp. JEL0407]|nr:hypothetical protein HK098_002148 [Nowakowskiella sp. JEL0407]
MSKLSRHPTAYLNRRRSAPKRHGPKPRDLDFPVHHVQRPVSHLDFYYDDDEYYDDDDYPVMRSKPLAANPPPVDHRAIMKRGYLIYKKVVGVSRRLVVLIAPDCIDDILVLHKILFNEDPVEKGQNPNTIALLGQIASSAIKGCPLLILFPSDEKNDASNITFIPFYEVRDVSSEQRLGSACNFSVTLQNKAEYRFASSNSSDYQEWYKNLEAAFQTIMQASSIAKSNIEGPPVLPNPLVSEPYNDELTSDYSEPVRSKSTKANKKLLRTVSTIVGSIFKHRNNNSPTRTASLKNDTEKSLTDETHVEFDEDDHPFARKYRMQEKESNSQQKQYFPDEHTVYTTKYLPQPVHIYHGEKELPNPSDDSLNSFEPGDDNIRDEEHAYIRQPTENHHRTIYSPFTPTSNDDLTSPIDSNGVDESAASKGNSGY